MLVFSFVRTEPGWQIMKMRYGHSVTTDKPRELAVALHELS